MPACPYQLRFKWQLFNPPKCCHDFWGLRRPQKRRQMARPDLWQNAIQKNRVGATSNEELIKIDRSAMKIHETSKILTVSDFPSLPEGPIRTLEMSWKKRITTIHLTNVTCIQVALAHQSATHEFLPCPTSQMLVLPGFESTNNSPAEPSKHLHSHHLHSPPANRLKQ